MAHTTSPSLLTQVPLDPQQRPRYTLDQLQTYFTRIRLPQEYLDSPIITTPSSSLARTETHGLPFLQALTRYHAAHVPFENLELHYSAHKTISLNTDALYTRFAERGLAYGRGGRCMENNAFFATVLRSLGFAVRNCAGRVSRAMSPRADVRTHQAATYDGWNHMLNLVRLDGVWWVVDVGMGAMGPNVPLPLREGWEVESIPPRRVRLQRRPLAESFAAGEEGEAGMVESMWCLDVCLRPGGEDARWTPAYSFTETEFLPQDYEVMSWFTSTNPRSFFTFSVLCTRMLLDEAGERIVGDVMLYNDAVRSNVGGQREVLRELKTERERVDALREIFGVELTEEEREGMQGDMRLG